MNSIVTFYSYKGGVGRSMALANVAILLARRNLRVLVVDWDLEAPGLDRYFASLKLVPGGNGLLPLILDAAHGQSPNYKDYLWKVIDNANKDVEFAFLLSGRESDSDYALKLERFDWRVFFAEQGGGDFIEELREQWHHDFDVVLIDSRTGLSDTGGICTIQLPDIVVPMFTANYQSLYGVRDIVRLAQQARQTLAYDRMPLTIFPLPSRFGVSSEFKESQEWIERFEEALAEFYRDWLPKWVRPRFVLERIKVPQIDYFGFGEKLAVVEQGISDPHGMGYIYNRVAELLAGDFSDVEGWLGPDIIMEAKFGTRPRRSIKSEVSPTPSKDYEFDLFVSYDRSPMIADWLREFLPLLTRFVEQLIEAPCRVFYDATEIQLGDEWWRAGVGEALSRSKLLLAAVTPRYFDDRFCAAEWKSFRKRAEITRRELVLPIVLTQGPYPKELRMSEVSNFEEYLHTDPDFHESIRYFDFLTKVRNLASTIVDLLSSAPSFSHKWPIVLPLLPRETGM